MIKNFFVTFCLFFALVTFSQEGSSSPYSFYGLGEMRFKGTAENRSMGGLSVFPDSIHINLQNPAFYSNLKLVGFTIGGTHATTGLKTNTQSENTRRTTLDYLAMGIPMGKFGAGFGLMPYTAVGYKLRRVTDEDIPQQQTFTGEGGLNKAFLGGAYQITKNFSIGAEVGYYFGDISTTSIYRISGVQLGTREINESTATGVGFNTGLAFTSVINKKYLFTASASYSPEASLTLANRREIGTVIINSQDIPTSSESVDIPQSNTTVKMPGKISFGAGIGQNRKWMVGTEAIFKQSSSMGNRFGDIQDATFENGYKYIVGGYYIPQFNSFSSYMKRVTYRGGLQYENTGLVINNKSIMDAGFTVGAGLPLSGTFSNINIGVEYGKRGTRDAGLVEENYINFTIGLSFNDRWFVKRRYD